MFEELTHTSSEDGAHALKTRMQLQTKCRICKEYKYVNKYDLCGDCEDLFYGRNKKSALKQPTPKKNSRGKRFARRRWRRKSNK